MVYTISEIDTGRRSLTRSATGTLKADDTPRSPVTAFFNQVKYWTISGSLRPHCSRTWS